MSTSLREPDVHAVLRLVGDAHHADDLDDFRAMLLAALPELVPADYVSYNEVSRASGPGIAIVTPELPEWAYAAWAHHGAENPLVQRHLRTQDGRAYRLSDVVTRAELHRLALYTELYAPLGVEHQLAFCLPAPATELIGIALTRGGPNFSERDRTVLNVARPHLIQAYRNVELRARAQALVAAMQTGLEDAQQAMVLVDDGRDVVFATESAKRMLRAATGATVTDGGPLPPDVAVWMRNGTDVPLVLDGRRPLAIRLLPGAAHRPDVLLLEPGMRAVGAGVLRGLGLTKREAEVLHLIVRGRSNDDIARDLAISPRTVHKHVEHVFAKLGVGSRLEAVATVWAAVGAEG